MDERREHWLEIEHLAEAMLDAARHERWEEVIEMEALRRGLLEQFFSRPPTADEAAELESDIRRVLEIDKELMSLGREEQTRIGNELSSLIASRRAASAYSENT